MWLKIFNDFSRKIGLSGPSSRSGKLISTNVYGNSSDGWIDVALSGTSNCVLQKGLSSGIAKHPDVRNFINESQGASGTVAIASHMHDFDLSGFHYLFIEYGINEAAMHKKGTATLENTYRHIAALVDHASRSGCTPILVNYPTLDGLGRSTQMLSMLEREFVQRGVAIFDVQKLLEARSKASGRDLKSCFRDPLHLKRPISYAVGTIMVDAALRARQSGAIHRNVELTDAVFGEVDYIPCTDMQIDNPD
jgi:hypothetical protein